MSRVPAKPARPRPSATVVLARDAAEGVEVLLMQRHASTSYGESYVFPGGLIEAGDTLPSARLAGIDPGSANAALGTAEGGVAYYSAAIRELFEEVGVLLARTPSGEWASGLDYPRERDELNAGSLDWRDFVLANDLTLAADALHYFSYWVTPRELRRRYTTRFFLAAMPEGQAAVHCGGEVVDSRWMTPPAALAAQERGEIGMPMPTEATLRDLQRFDSVAGMLAWADGLCREGVACYLPAMVTVSGEPAFVMPDDPRYPDYTDAGEGDR